MPETFETVTIEAKNGDLIARGVVWHDSVVHLRIVYGDTYVSPLAITYPSLSALTAKMDQVGGVVRLHVPANDAAPKSL